MKLSDFSYVQRENRPHGRVILIGMMEDGPTGNPFTLIDETKATKLLGDNETSRAYNLLIEDGTPKENIFLFRLNGSPGEAIIDINDETVLTLQSVSSHVEEQNINLRVSEEGIALYSNYSEEAIETGKRRDFKRTYRFDEYPYMTNLAEAITKDAAIGMHGVIAESSKPIKSNILTQGRERYVFVNADQEASLIMKDGSFTPGSIEEEGSYLNDYWTRFYLNVLGVDFDGESSSKLNDIDAEVIYFTDVPVDDAKEIALLSARVAQDKAESQGLMCTALFRTNNVPKVKSLEEYEYRNEDNTYFNPETGQNEKWEPHKEQDEFISKLTNLFTEEEKNSPEVKHIQIVVGEEINIEGEIIPGAAHHLKHLLKSNLNSTANKELSNFLEVNTVLDKIVLDKLSRNGYICIVESIRRNAVTSKVKSPYNGESILDEFLNKKILSYISYDICSILDRYIGNSVSSYNTTDLDEVFNEYLMQYVDAEVIKSYTLGEREYGDVAGNASIKLDIVLHGQIEGISGAVRLKETGWEVDLWTV